MPVRFGDLRDARGGMENRLKDQQVDLSADRTSCHRFWSNQFRQLLSALAYTLVEGLRRLVFRDTRYSSLPARTASG